MLDFWEPKATDNLIEQNLKLIYDEGELLDDPLSYRQLVGRSIFLAITRPDITYSVNILSQFMHTTRKPYWSWLAFYC